MNFNYEENKIKVHLYKAKNSNSIEELKRLGREYGLRPRNEIKDLIRYRKRLIDKIYERYENLKNDVVMEFMEKYPEETQKIIDDILKEEIDKALKNR